MLAGENLTLCLANFGIGLRSLAQGGELSRWSPSSGRTFFRYFGGDGGSTYFGDDGGSTAFSFTLGSTTGGRLQNFWMHS